MWGLIFLLAGFITKVIFSVAYVSTNAACINASRFADQINLVRRFYNTGANRLNATTASMQAKPYSKFRLDSSLPEAQLNDSFLTGLHSCD